MGQCSANYNVELIPLAFDISKKGLDFVGDTVFNIDEVLKKSLNNRDFQAKLEKQLREYTAIVVRDIKAGKQIDAAGADAFIDTSKKAFGESVKTSIMSNPKLTLLKQEAQAFKQAFECSPTGIWVNENRTVVIVVGVLGVVGGVTYMYKNRTGDFVANLSKDLLQKSWKIGTIDLATRVTHFKPSNREFGAELKSSSKWKQFKTDVAMSFLVQDKTINFSTKSSVAVKLSTDKTLSLGMTNSTSNSNGIPPVTNQGLSSETTAFVNFEYKKDRTTLKLGADFETDKKPSYFISLDVRF